MRIDFDFEYNEDHVVIARHYIDSDDLLAMAVITKLNRNALPIAGTGWDEVSEHPDYPGKTRLEVVNAEMTRLGVKP